MGWMIKKKSAPGSAVGLLKTGLRWSQGLKDVLSHCVLRSLELKASYEEGGPG